MSGLLAPLRQRGYRVDADGSAVALVDDWQTAFLSKSATRLRDWYARNTGPRVRPLDRTPLTGEVGVASQADADRLAGRVINGNVVISTNNVTLRDFWLFSNGTDIAVSYPSAASGIELHHLYLDGSRLSNSTRGLGGGSAAGVHAHHIEIQGFMDGLRYAAGGLYEYLYVHDVMEWAKVSTVPYDGLIHPHIDGSQFVGAAVGGGFTLRHSFIEAMPGAGVVSAIILNAALGPISNVLVEENYLSGGGFTIQNPDPGAGHGSAVATFRNNMFGTDWSSSGGGLWNLMDPTTVTRVGNLYMHNHRPVPLTLGALAKP